MTIHEERRISASAIRSICIKNDWYTHGTNGEYESMMKIAENGNATKEHIFCTALDIVNHSDMEHYYNSGYSKDEVIANVMCYISNDALRISYTIE